ncbi:MAG TPA: replicative DNA helicase [Chitinophagales bacterium]|nr:replicative DNA helicase [Chitinophagales bacterium]
MYQPKINDKNKFEDKSLQVYGKIPPQALELEVAVLGAILIEKEAFNAIASFIRPECFYVDAHSTIYQACTNLFVKSQPIDSLTVTEELRNNGKLEEIGGAYYLSDLTNKVASSANIVHHARIIFQKYMQRSAITISNTIINKAYEDVTDPFELLEKAQLQFSNITENLKNSKVSHIANIALMTISQMKENQGKDLVHLGLTSGLSKIDNITLGFCKPDLIIIAGGTSEGKSTLALQIAKHVSINNKVAFFSLEMSNQQLVWKVFSSEINASVAQIRKGKLSTEQWQKLESDVYDDLVKSNFYLYDEGGLSIFDLVSICRTLKAKQGLDMIVIDYLQLLTATGADIKFGIREQEINFISKKLKALAKELNIPVIALSQLSRIEKGTKRLYKLSDLRESGAIEQDADGVMFVFRPHYHDIRDMKINGEEMIFSENDTIIQFAKWRLGETGMTMLKFNKECSRFEDPSFLQEFVEQPAQLKTDEDLPF